jgi:CheY-like chemotaxis protein
MKRIFVVAIDQTTREAIRHALELQEFDVIGFGSPAGALAAALSNPPDLLISDAELADTTGVDLASALRTEVDPDLPVVLFSARRTMETVAKARRQGIRHFLQLPFAPPDTSHDNTGRHDFCELFAAVRRELFWTEAADTVGNLDDLRSEFFVDLSHQLRTPMTAMKLAMDGLFSQLQHVMDPSQRNLASISSRSIERIVNLVENQLNLLQMMAGQRHVCRRLVDLVQLVRDLSGRAISRGESDRDLMAVVTEEHARSAGPQERLFAFTDPECLTTLLECMMGGAPQNSRRTVRLDYDPELQLCRLDVRVDHLCRPTPARTTRSGDTALVGMLDFEYRAYQTVLGAIGGDLVMEKDDDHKWIRVYLPRYPSYDRRKDFVDPVRSLRSGGGDRDGVGRKQDASGAQFVHFVKCDLGNRAGEDYLRSDDSGVGDFLERVTSTLADGEAVVRGRHHGTVYLVLRDRSHHELERLVSFFENGGDGDSPDSNAAAQGTADRQKRPADGPLVWKPQTIVADEHEIDRLVGDLERV